MPFEDKLNKLQRCREVAAFIFAKMPYISDWEKYGPDVRDYWPTLKEAEEYIRKSLAGITDPREIGEDCDGQAIAMAGMLWRDGFSQAEVVIALCAVYDRPFTNPGAKIKGYHAVCMWRENAGRDTGEDPWVLNNDGSCRRLHEWPQLEPYGAFNLNSAWDMRPKGGL